METENQYEKIVPYVMFILALILLFALIRPMITILLSSILIAYIANPLYTKINKKITNKTTSIILSLLIISVLVLIPISFLVFGVTQQAFYFSNSVSNRMQKGALFGYGCNSANSELCSLLNRVEIFSKDRLSKYGIDKQLQEIIPIMQHKLINLLMSIPIIVAEVFITLVISFFILSDWENLLKKTVHLLPTRAKAENKIIDQFGDITNTVIYAQLFVALVQGIVGTIGFYLFGVPFPFILGVVLAFCALIPTIGTALIWAPASLFLIISGYYSHDYWLLGKGIGMFLYGLLIISTIDNILLAKIVNSKAKVNQILVIVGVIGGGSMFGVVGIFIGPILLPLIITYFETFHDRFANTQIP